MYMYKKYYCLLLQCSVLVEYKIFMLLQNENYKGIENIINVLVLIYIYKN